MPANSSFSVWAYAEVEDARRSMGAAMAAAETAEERRFEGPLHRRAGAIAPKSPPTAAVQAQAHFERAPAVARERRAKSWDLSTTLWRDPGNNRIPMVFSPASMASSQRFDTLDLKDSKAVLEERA
jgi:hypothetical protein